MGSVLYGQQETKVPSMSILLLQFCIFCQAFLLCPTIFPSLIRESKSALKARNEITPPNEQFCRFTLSIPVSPSF